MILVVPYFEPPDTERKEELRVCLKRNLQLFSEVRLLPEGPNGERQTYAQAWDAGTEHRLVVVANSDIEFDSSIELLTQLDVGTLACVTRHEEDGSLYYGGKWSQDVWAWRNPSEFRPDPSLRFGDYGSENRLAHDARAAGMRVVNPSLSIKCTHRHKSRVSSRVVLRPKLPGRYLLVEPHLWGQEPVYEAHEQS